MANLSVLITYFNEKELLTQCLDSLSNQTKKVSEILIYDDASQFPAKDYIPQAMNVEIIRGEKNVGPSRGRNALLKKAKGDFIHFHDSDDLFKPEWCEKVSQGIDRGADCVFTEIESYYGSELPHPSRLASPKVTQIEKLKTQDFLHVALTGFVLVPSGTYRTELLRELNGYSETLWQAEDFHFHVRLALKAPKTYVIDETLVQIRLREESRSQNKAEVYTSLWAALKDLEPLIPTNRLSDWAEAAANTGSFLFREGKYPLAREAFSLAEKKGPPHFLDRSPLYRATARWLNPLAAEYVGLVYRTVIPTSVRKALRKGA